MLHNYSSIISVFIISYFCISFNSYRKCRNIISMHFKIGVKFMKRTYTQEEKQAIIDRFISGEPSANILADTGIPKRTFYGWLRAYREKQDASKQKTVNIRNFHLLENKVAHLESIIEILKSSPCTPKSPLNCIARSTARNRTFEMRLISTFYSTTPSAHTKNCNTRLPNRRKKNMPWKLRIYKTRSNELMGSKRFVFKLSDC